MDIRAEPHLTSGETDKKDWVAQNAVAFSVTFGICLALLMAFCIYALKRGPDRPLCPCLSRRRRTVAPVPAAGPDYSVWATTGQSSDWGQKVYLTDLKRQSMVQQFSQPGFDQRVMDWRSRHPQAQVRWSDQSHIPSPLGSGSGGGSAGSPASTAHILTKSRSPASTTLSPSRGRRGSSLPSSPLATAPSRERESFGHTPSMYTASSTRGSMPASTLTEVTVPPLAKVAYSPFAPRGSVLQEGGQRGSIVSQRGYAV